MKENYKRVVLALSKKKTAVEEIMVGDLKDETLVAIDQGNSLLISCFHETRERYGSLVISQEKQMIPVVNCSWSSVEHLAREWMSKDIENIFAFKSHMEAFLWCAQEVASGKKELIEEQN